MRLSVAYKIGLLFAVPMVAVLSYVFYLNEEMRTLDKYQKLQTKVAEVSILRDRFAIALNRARMLQTLYIATENPEYRLGYVENAKNTLVALKNLAYACQDDPAMYAKLRFFYSQLQHTMGAVPEFLMRGEREHFKLSDITGGAFGMISYRMYFMKSTKLFYAEDSLDNPFKSDLDKNAVAAQQKIANQLLVSAGAALVFWLVLIGSFMYSITSRLKNVHKNIAELVDGTFDFRNAGDSDEIDDLNACIIDSGEQMKVAEEAKAQAIRLFAEELSRPLSALKDMLHELRAHGFISLSDKGNDRLTTAASETERLQLLVADLIKVQESHIAAYDLQLKEFDLSLLAHSAVSSLEEFAKTRSVEFRTKLQKVIVVGDEQRIRQVVINLLSNAVKFSPAHASITVFSSKDGQQGLLSVTDEGPGISEDFKKKIFSKFEQSAGAAPGGTGLGLAISRELMRAQSGRLEFESPVKDGKGARFFISLPTAERRSNISKQPAGPGSVAGRKYRQNLWLKGALIISLPFIIHLVMCAALYAPLASFHENMVQLSNGRIIANVQADVVQHGLDGALHAIVWNVYRAKDAYQEAKEQQRVLSERIAQLKQLTDVAPKLADDITALEQMVQKHIRLENEIINAPRNADADPWLGKDTIHESEKVLIYTGLLEKINEQSKSIIQRTEDQHQLRQVMNVILIVASILASVFSSVCVFLWIKGWTRRIGPLLENVRSLAKGEALPYMAYGNDELAFIDHSVHDAFYKLEELKAFKAQMLSVTSHELRTPLTSISAMSEMAEVGIFGPLNETGAQLIKMVRERISDLTLMVTNLLDLEKMQSGKVLVHKDELNLSDAVEAVVANVNDLSVDREVSISVSNTVSEITGDRQRIMQALTALMRHLIQVLPKHSQVDLRCEPHFHRVDIVVAAPYETASAMQHAARAQLVNELSRAIAEQHGGAFFVSAAKDARRYVFQLPAGAAAPSIAS